MQPTICFIRMDCLFSSRHRARDIRYEARSEVFLHAYQEIPRGLPRSLRVIFPKRIDNPVLMIQTLDDSLQDSLTIVRAPNQVQGVERNHHALQSLLHVTITRALPYFFPEVQMAFEKLLEVFTF